MSEIINALKELALIFIPRYVTDRVALARNNSGHLDVLCLEGQEIDGDELCIECYGTIKTFTWLNISKGGMVAIDKEPPQ
jgi:hypothetical protein